MINLSSGVCPEVSLGIGVITVNKTHKPPVLTELTFLWQVRHKPKYIWSIKTGKCMKENKAEDGSNEHQGLEGAILNQIVREHFNRNLKSRRNSRLKDTKQSYVSWPQSRAMRSGQLEQVRRKVAERGVEGAEEPGHIGRLQKPVPRFDFCSETHKYQKVLSREVT